MAYKNALIKCLENIICKSNDARKWYLKTDLKVRLKLFIDDDCEFQDFINIWKRINIIRKDFGDSSQSIIDEAVQELAEELKSYDNWVKRANIKLEKLLDLKDEYVRII